MIGGSVNKAGAGRGSNRYKARGTSSEVAGQHSAWVNPTKGIDKITPILLRVLESAAKLQAVLPDAVLVGGASVALYAQHRESLDHDPVLADLNQRFDMVLEALEATEGWVTNRIVPNKLILGELGGIQAGVRQLRRVCPLEVESVQLSSGMELSVLTLAETLRLKGYLIVARNAARDFLDVAALSGVCGADVAADVFTDIDPYYEDQLGPKSQGVASQLAIQLANPQPRDQKQIRNLPKWKNLVPDWCSWDKTISACQDIATRMVMR
ncbi:MAG: hypothetical protein M1483_01550 [Actinobacteria bacterium]|nr:hypothetical protein [Actinomycetota bacterium]